MCFLGSRAPFSAARPDGVRQQAVMMTMRNNQPPAPEDAGNADDLEITFVSEGHVEDAARRARRRSDA